MPIKNEKVKLILLSGYLYDRLLHQAFNQRWTLVSLVIFLRLYRQSEFG